MTRTRNLRRLRSGSALVYMSMLIVAITSVVVTTANLNVATTKKAERQIEAVLTAESESGVVAAVRARCNVNNITLPQNWNFSLNGQTQSVTVTDNSGTMDRTYNVETTIAGKSTSTVSRVIAGRQTSNPFYYALWLDQSTDLNTRRVVATGNGHIFCRGNLTLRSTSSVDGEVIATGSITTNGANIEKNVIAQARNRTLPSIEKQDYKRLVPNDTSKDLNGITFLPALLGNPYHLRFFNKNLTLSGTIAGKGTCFADSNVTVTGNVDYLNGAARAVFIVEGNLVVNAEVTSMVGTWIVKGNATFNASGTTLDITRGNLVVAGNFELNRDLNIGGDTSFWAVRNDGLRHRLPGFFPTVAAGLMR